MKINKIMPLVFVMLITKVNLAWATTYECTTEQMYIWLKGKIEQKDSKEIFGFYFNDESGILEIYENKEISQPSAPIKLNVLNKLGKETELIATEMLIDKWGELHDNILKIRPTNTLKKLDFLFYKYPNMILSGKCSTTQK